MATTPKSPSKITVSDVTGVFNCGSNFLSMRQAVYNDSNKPIMMSMFYGRSPAAGEGTYDLAFTNNQWYRTNSSFSSNDGVIEGNYFWPVPGALYAQLDIPFADSTYDIEISGTYLIDESGGWLKIITDGVEQASWNLGPAQLGAPLSVTAERIKMNQTTKIRMYGLNANGPGAINLGAGTNMVVSEMPPEVSITSSGFDYAGWSSDVQGASPYRRPSNNELAILYDSNGGDPGLWASRAIPFGTDSTRYMADIRFTGSYWRSESSKTMTFKFYTDGENVRTLSISTSERSWKSLNVLFTDVIVNNTTTVRISSTNGTGWGEIGLKDLTITITPKEAVDSNTNYLSAVVVSGPPVEYPNSHLGNVTIQRNTNTITSRKLILNGTTYDITSSTTVTGSDGEFVSGSWDKDIIAYSFQPKAGHGTYELRFVFEDNEGRVVYTEVVEMVFTDPATRVIHKDHFSGTTSYFADSFDAEDDVLAICDSRYEWPDGTLGAVFIIRRDGFKWELAEFTTGGLAILGPAHLGNNSRIGGNRNSLSLARNVYGNYVLAVGSTGNSTGDGVSTYGQGSVHVRHFSITTDLNKRVDLKGNAMTLRPSGSQDYYFGSAVYLSYNDRLVAFTETKSGLGREPVYPVMEMWSVGIGGASRLRRDTNMPNGIGLYGASDYNYVDAGLLGMFIGAPGAYIPGTETRAGAIMSFHMTDPSVPPSYLLEPSDMPGESSKGYNVSYSSQTGKCYFGSNSHRSVNRCDVVGNNIVPDVIPGGSSSYRYSDIHATAKRLVALERDRLEDQGTIYVYNADTDAATQILTATDIQGFGWATGNVCDNKKRFTKGVDTDDNGYLFVGTSEGVGIWYYNRAEGKFE